VLVGCGSEPRYDAVVAAASDTRDAFAEVAAFAKQESDVDIGFVFGSSGLLREQVLAGAPYDVYVSANRAFVDEVVDAGFGDASTRDEFAVGRLAIISADGKALPIEANQVPDSSRVVIANPAHAPYGVAAREALQTLGLYDELVGRLVLADNVADAVRIVQAGEADLGIVALSLVINEPHLVVEESLHQPIRQTLVVTTRGSDNPAAKAFVAALQSAEGRAILQRYGFTVKS
jgi:molybdate transport system substrate-binding protein